MPNQENQVKYWRERAKRAEDSLKREAHMNSFIIAYIKRIFPDMHKRMCDYYVQQAGAKLASQRQALQQRHRQRITAA